jgi:hypothetical protein
MMPACPTVGRPSLARLAWPKHGVGALFFIGKGISSQLNDGWMFGGEAGLAPGAHQVGLVARSQSGSAVDAHTIRRAREGGM